MNGELLAVFEYLERERGISRDVLIETVESSLLSAAKKHAGQVQNLTVAIDRETGKIRALCDMLVVDRVSAEEHELSLEDALKIAPSAKVGDTVHKEIMARELGRIAAQTAKQVIIQRIREAEHKIVYTEYKDRAGDIITGAVRRYERGNVILDLGKAEAVLTTKEQCPRESYGVGRRLRVYVVEVNEGAKGPEIIVSRSHPDFVKRLFEIEVPEISEGTVTIKAVARDPGYRTKIAVSTKSEKVDPVGACVGMRGARVKDIVRELNGERVDIIRWHEDITVFITNALSPGKLKEVRLVGEKRAEIIVDDDQFSLAVGKKGQGIRLISNLTGWSVDIKKASDLEREGKEAGIPLAKIEGIGAKTARILKEGGYKTLGALRMATAEELVKLPGIGEKTVEKIMHAAASFRDGREEKAAPPVSAKDEEAAPAPEAGGTVPDDEAASPVDEAAAPVDETAAPGEETVAPSEETAAPVDETAA
ncbi:MAG: transcription termination factor NusA, partial [Candidatus Aureabacteria bacterium]|nr:transcription termination factor NusA [Candidatus Auribacterota bacterium]